ncbi:MAG: rhomboid family intramembrane serine protease [Nitrospirota bacterium]
MIPLKDDNPTKTFPIITILIIAINIFVYFYMLTLDDDSARHLVNLYGATPYELMHGYGLNKGVSLSIMLTVITSMFLHGGFFHLLSNMLYLWVFGNNIEDSMGHFRFIVFYAICGSVAVFAHALINQGSTLPMIGASGAISGVLGAYLILFPRARVLTLLPLGFFMQVVKIPALFFLGFWIAFQIINSTFSIGKGGDGIAWFAHIGGFLAGLLLIVFFKKRNSRFSW